MKSFVLLSALTSLASAAALAAEPVCKPALHTKLANCPSGAAFCSSLLGYSAGATKPTLTISTQTTSTVTTTMTKYEASTTAFVTTTLAGVSTTSTSTTTITVGTATLTSPSGLTGSPTCYVSTLYEASRGVPAAQLAAAATSCGLKQAPSVISTACSCFIDPVVTATMTTTKTVNVKITGVATVTLTRYSTSTFTRTSTSPSASTTRTVVLPACPTPISNCSNTGLQWAYYNAASTSGGSALNPANIGGFDPSLYKTITPTINGTTQIISIAYTGTGSGTGLFYGKGPENLFNYFVDHKGYLYAPQTGNYTFGYDFVDDQTYLYLGSKAVSGWTGSNYDFYAYYSSSNLAGVTVRLTQGQYFPFRVGFGQGTGAGGLGFQLQAPDGSYVMNDLTNLTASPYVVWHSCDNTAPAFPAWGMET